MKARKLLAFSGLFSLIFVVGCDNSWQIEQAYNHYAQSQILADSGDLDEALVELSKAIENDPDLSLAYTSCGDIYRKRGDFLQAVESYQSACKVNPYAFRPHYNLGVTYQFLSEKSQTAKQADEYQKKAAHTYLRAITIIPDDFDTNLNLGACYFQLGKYDLAEEYCKDAIQADPQNPQAYSNLGIIFDSQNRFYDAIKAYKTSLELDTNQPKILLNLGSTYLRQGPNPIGRVKAALRVFKIAAQKAPDDPAPYKQIGLCYYRMKQYSDAIEAYEKAIEIDKNSAEAYRGLGTVYITKFILDPKQPQLCDIGIEAWNMSLDIDPRQEDLIKLVKKYAPREAMPQI